jgi:hypothetical protein
LSLFNKTMQDNNLLVHLCAVNDGVIHRPSK